MVQINKVKDFNARDDASIRHLIHRSNLVINLIGIQKETMNWSFDETHIDVAARIAEAVRDNDMVERFWHVSCLGASENSESKRLRSKVHSVLPPCIASCNKNLHMSFSASGMQMFRISLMLPVLTWHLPCIVASCRSCIVES